MKPARRSNGVALLASVRQRARDHLPTVPTINAEVSIGAEDDWVGVCLRHADEAGVCKAHRHVSIFSHQQQHRRLFSAQIECQGVLRDRHLRNTYIAAAHPGLA